MTCIIGLVHETKVYIGADSIAVAGWEQLRYGWPKVFRVGEFLIGCAGSLRMLQILKFHLDIRLQQEGESDERYIVVAFVDAVRQALKERGYTHIDNNREEGGRFLAGYRGQLYLVDEDFQATCFTGGLKAIGVGAEYAMGAMMALHTWQPEDRILQALAISAELSIGVGAPFYVEAL